MAGKQNPLFNAELGVPKEIGFSRGVIVGLDRDIVDYQITQVGGVGSMWELGEREPDVNLAAYPDDIDVTFPTVGIYFESLPKDTIEQLAVGAILHRHNTVLAMPSGAEEEHPQRVFHSYSSRFCVVQTPIAPSGIDAYLRHVARNLIANRSST